jgi:hypothetical protein
MTKYVQVEILFILPIFRPFIYTELGGDMPLYIPTYLQNFRRNYLMNLTKIIMICIRRDQQYALIVPLLYSTYWLLHVSAVACLHQGAY